MAQEEHASQHGKTSAYLLFLRVFHRSCATIITGPKLIDWGLWLLTDIKMYQNHSPTNNCCQAKIQKIQQPIFVWLE